jgi:predicted GNAT family N-acyltransferase
MEDGIRFAETPEELHAAYQLRYKTYVTSMGFFNDSCDHTRQELKDDYDDNAKIVVAIKDHKVIGTLRVLWGKEIGFDRHLTEAYRISAFSNTLDSAKICIVERLVVDNNHRGSTAMLRMFNVVIAFILSQQIELLLINAETQHINTYIKLGCVPFTKQFLYPGVGPVSPMALVVGDFQNLVRVGSPFSLLTTAEDTNFCRHTQQLLDIIKLEATVTYTPNSRTTSAKITAFPAAANHPIYAIKSVHTISRLRQRLAIT